MRFARKVFMVRPTHFGLNVQTAKTNSFQSKIKFIGDQEISNQARVEFDNAVNKMQGFGIDVQVFQDTETPIKPDAVFPNNWISTHSTGQVFVYPMLTKNRQSEVREDIISSLKPVKLIDLRVSEAVLEGTGSMVMDHESKLIYCCFSERTHMELVEKVASELGYPIYGFHSTDHQNNPIYHTNVVMFVMNGLVGIGLETIKDELERNHMLQQILDSGKEPLELSYYQITQFAGNMLQVLNKQGSPVLVCSKTAWNSLDENQKKRIEKNSKVCQLDIPTIELYGGGSARCMIAENYL